MPTSTSIPTPCAPTRAPRSTRTAPGAAGLARVLPTPVGRRVAALALGAGLAALALVPGCYAPQLGLLRSGLDSLRTVVDTLVVRDSVAYRVLVDTRKQVA